MLESRSFLGVPYCWLQDRILTGQLGPSARIRQEPIDKRFSTGGILPREAVARSTTRSLIPALHVDEINCQIRGLKEETETWCHIFSGSNRAAESVEHSRHNERALLPLPDNLDVDVIPFAADGNRAAFDHRSRNILCVANSSARKRPSAPPSTFQPASNSHGDRMSRTALGGTQCRQAHGRQVGKIE